MIYADESSDVITNLHFHLDIYPRTTRLSEALRCVIIIVRLRVQTRGVRIVYTALHYRE